MRVLLLAFLVAVLSACDGPIDLVDPYDRIQGEPSGQTQSLGDTAVNEPEAHTVASGTESGGAGGETHTNEAAGDAEGH